MTIFLAILAALCFMGIMANESKRRFIAYVVMFIVCIIAIVLLKIF